MKRLQEHCDVAVIGGGPAGLMAAIAAASGGRSVVVCEQLDRPGAKLLITGGGRCNITNDLPADTIMAAFGRQGRFMQPALAAMDPAALREFLQSIGLPTRREDSGQVYPASNRAADVLACLLARCKQLGARLLTGRRVTGLLTSDGAITGLKTSAGIIETPAVVIATGGRSYAELGATGIGYELARAAGHEIVKPTPALVGLVTSETWPAQCAGLSICPARVWIDLPRQPKAGHTGDVLLTHRGVSGPAVLDISGDVAVLLERGGTVPLRLDLTPDVSAAQWRARIDALSHREGRRTIQNVLAGEMAARLATVVCELANTGPDCPVSQLPRPTREALAGLLTAMPVTVIGSEGFEKAMITRGGVSLKQIDPRTMESKLVPGLRFAGEVVDLDGPCGGFNLQWAFASGNLAGSMR